MCIHIITYIYLRTHCVTVCVVVCSVHDAGDCADIDDGPVQIDPSTQDEADTRHVYLHVHPRTAAVYKG